MYPVIESAPYSITGALREEQTTRIGLLIQLKKLILFMLEENQELIDRAEEDEWYPG